MKRTLSLLLVLALLLPALAVGAAAVIEEYTLEVGDTKLLKIDPDGKALENSVWESNSPDVIVTEQGLTYCTIEAVAPTEGMTAIVSCTYRYWLFSGNFQYLATGRESFYVTVEAVDPTAISLPASRRIGLGERTTLTPTFTPTGATATLTWSTGNSSVATVDEYGTVYGVSGGSTRITVRTHNGLSASCTVTVAEPSLTLTSSIPASGNLEWEADGPITLTYSAQLDSGPAWDQIALADSATGQAVALQKALSGRKLLLTPQSALQPGHAYTLTVPAGALENLTGSPLAQGSTLTFSVRAMTLAAVQPEDGAEGVPTGQTFLFTFDVPLSPGWAWGEIALTGPEGPVPIQTQLDGQVLSVTPLADLDYAAEYALTVPAGALAGPGGGENTVAYSLTFTTRAGAPQLVSTSPAEGEAFADPDGALTLTFRYPIEAGPAATGISLLRADTGEAVDGQLTFQGEVLTFTPAAELELSAPYTLTIPAGGVQNDQGQTNGAPYFLSFTTWDASRQEVPPPVFSQEGGIYEPGDTVSLTCAQAGASIYYTADGSDPASNGQRYTGPISLASGEVLIRAVAVAGGAVSGESQARFSPPRAFTPGRIDSLGTDERDEFMAAAAGDGAWAAVGFVTLDGDEPGDWGDVTPRGGQDAAIVQYSPEGELQWKAVFGGNLTDEFDAVAPLPGGDWAVAGYSNLGSNPGGDWGSWVGPGNWDAVVARFDSTGNLAWCTSLGGAGTDRFLSLAVGQSGVAAAGYTFSASAGTGDLAGLDYRGGARDGLVAAYDLAGNRLWHRLYGGAGTDYLYGMAAADDGYVAVGYVSASSLGTGDLAGCTGRGGIDAVIVKFDLEGRIVWQTTFGGKADDQFFAVTAVPDGFVAVGSSDEGSFGTGDWAGVTGVEGNGATVVKFSPTGQLEWAKPVDGDGNDFFKAVTDTGYGLAAGGYSSQSTPGTGDWAGTPSRGANDATVVLLTYQGEVWGADSLGGKGADTIYGLAALPQGLAAVGSASVGSFENGDLAQLPGWGSWDALFQLYTVQARLSFDPAGGAGAPESRLVSQGEAVALPTQIPSKDGSRFLGWSPWADVQAAVYQPGEDLTLTQDLTLYAVWDQDCPAGSLGLTGSERVRAGEEFTRTLYFRAEAPVQSGRVTVQLPQGISCLGLENPLAGTSLIQSKAEQEAVAVTFSLPQPLQAGEVAAIGTLRLLADNSLTPGSYTIQADLGASFLTAPEGETIPFSGALFQPVTVEESRTEELFLLGPSLIAGPTQFQLAAFPALPAGCEPVWQVTGGQATVDQNGLVTPLADGQVTLTAVLNGKTATATITAQLPAHTLSGSSIWQDGIWTVETAFLPAADKTLLAAWRGPDGALGPVSLQEVPAGQTQLTLTLEAPAEGVVTLYLLQKGTWAPLAPACPAQRQE